MLRLRTGTSAPGVERLEAWLRGARFTTHRHDTYAIGVTLRGVQRFAYRGGEQHGLAGTLHILHPDEPHDGEPGTDDGFGYRILYIDPALIRDSLGDTAALPFVADPIVDAARAPRPLIEALADLERPLDEFAGIEIADAAAELLIAAATQPDSSPRTLPLARLRRVRDAIATDPSRVLSAAELEQIAGLDRWSIARHFRRAFGTSPTRYRTMRRLDGARALIESGRSLADAAAGAGFSDQSHLTREFRRAYGVTPHAWRRARRS